MIDDLPPFRYPGQAPEDERREPPGPGARFDRAAYARDAADARALSPHYPGDEDVRAARENDQFYGDPRGGYTHPGANMRTIDIDHPMAVPVLRRPNMWMDVGRSRITPEMADAMTRTAAATNRSAIGSLGYDPDRMLVTGRSPNEFSFAGQYNRGKDALWVRSDRSSPAHESLHRGIQQLAKRGLISRDARDEGMPVVRGKPEGSDEEEILVRALMQKHYGDVETDEGSYPPEIAAGKQLLAHEKGRKLIDNLEALAAREIQRDRPGGPR